MSKKIISIVASVVTIAILFIGYSFYKKIHSKNVTKNFSLYIKSSDDFDNVKEKITPFLNDVDGFIWVANRKNYKKPKAGRYILKKDMSNNDLVNLLRSGNQTAIKLSFNNQNTLENLAGRVAAQLEADSISLLTSFKDPAFLSKNKFTEKSVLQIFIPNSYQFYWNTSASRFRDKMLAEYHRFWNNDRIAKAKALKLSKNDVITLASIVQKETAKKTERPIVAGLYLNRLKNGWPLQADPTVIYCVKEKKGQNYVVKRVLTEDLKIKSPYNTYLNKGLPPTLIGMPDISAIDGVLNAKKHNYYFMCANVEKLGYHAFARTISQHNRNATKYHRWLDRQRINR